MLMDTNLDATQQDFAVTAQASGKALIALINEVLDQAKIESGRLELEAVPFDVRDVLDNVLSIFSDKSQAKGIEVKVELAYGAFVFDRHKILIFVVLPMRAAGCICFRAGSRSSRWGSWSLQTDHHKSRWKFCEGLLNVSNTLPIFRILSFLFS